MWYLQHTHTAVCSSNGYLCLTGLQCTCFSGALDCFLSFKKFHVHKTGQTRSSMPKLGENCQVTFNSSTFCLHYMPHHKIATKYRYSTSCFYSGTPYLLFWCGTLFATQKLWRFSMTFPAQEVHLPANPYF